MKNSNLLLSYSLNKQINKNNIFHNNILRTNWKILFFRKNYTVDS